MDRTGLEKIGIVRMKTVIEEKPIGKRSRLRCGKTVEKKNDVDVVECRRKMEINVFEGLGVEGRNPLEENGEEEECYM